MKTLFLFLLLAFAFQVDSQTICGTAPEGGTVTLTAPTNGTITSIDFASYGTPNGACGSFTIGGCNALNSVSIVAGIFVGQHSASISATNGIFGDPCGGTFKRLYIQATYSFPLPLNILSFTIAPIAPGKAELIWQTSDELNTSQFIIEKSNDGKTFSSAGFVNAAGSGNHDYKFDDAVTNFTVVYYRLKLVDQDGKFKYSKTVRFDSHAEIPSIIVSSMVISGNIRIISKDEQPAYIYNSGGQIVQAIQLVKGDQDISVGNYSPGIYFIKTMNGVARFLKL